jgi:hypothetical protein
MSCFFFCSRHTGYIKSGTVTKAFLDFVRIAPHRTIHFPSSLPDTNDNQFPQIKHKLEIDTDASYWSNVDLY